MVATVAPDKMERLIFIKNLFTLAQEQYEKKYPANIASILLLHDTVDLILQIAGEEKHLPLKQNMYLSNYIDEFNKASIHLPYQTALRRLNTIRNNLKHNLIRPTEEEVTQIFGSIRDFLNDVIPLIFGIGLHEITFLSLIRNEGVKTCLIEAQELMNKEQYSEAAVQVKLAYHRLFKSQFGIHDYFKGAKRTSIHDQIYINDPHAPVTGRQMHDYITKILKQIEKVGTIVTCLTMDMPIRKLFYLETVTPQIMFFDNGSSRTRPKEVSKDDCLWAFQFVQELAVHLEGIHVRN